MSTLARRAMRRRFELHFKEIDEIEAVVSKFSGGREEFQTKPSLYNHTDSSATTGYAQTVANNNKAPLLLSEEFDKGGRHTDASSMGDANNRMAGVNPSSHGKALNLHTTGGSSKETASSTPQFQLFSSVQPRCAADTAAIGKFRAYCRAIKHMHKGLKKGLQKIEDTYQKQADERWNLMRARAELERRRRLYAKMDWGFEDTSQASRRSSLCQVRTPEDLLWEDIVAAEAEISMHGYAYRKDKVGRRVLHL